MSALQNRAWLALWIMCPVYFLYFANRIGLPSLFTTMLERIGLLALLASLHAVAYVSGLLLIKRREADEPLLEDERDRVFDGRATRTAYFSMLTGLIVVGMAIPFSNTGWQLVNAALFSIVLTETALHAMILIGYRQPRLGH
jgi:hypothetical protein